MSTNRRYVFLLALVCERLIVANCSIWSCGNPLQNFLAHRILGGQDVGYLKYPWFAGIVINGTYTCGGTLIAPGYVVTAAHCVNVWDPDSEASKKSIIVTLGMYDTCTSEITRHQYPVSKIYTHEQYPSGRPYYDIGLLRLEGETAAFQPICLPKVEALAEESSGKQAYIIGVGTLDAAGTKWPCAVHEATVEIHSQHTCKWMVRMLGNEANKFKNAFCAGNLAGGVDACQGDSGGPLMIIGDTGKYTLLGITSLGFGCGEEGTLGVYTEVARYIDWLLERIRA